MNLINADQLDSAISALCPEIWENMRTVSKAKYSEEKLWEELVCCILSSQVKYASSQAVTLSLKCKGLLDLEVFNGSYEDQLRIVLKSPTMVDGRPIKYRFPNTKAKQITSARKNIYEGGLTLKELLDEYSNPSDLRTILIKLVPGLGMKQASMYLRNTSKSYELAVIDTHVLKYMNIIDLIKKVPSSISNAGYLSKENMLTKYAKKFGYPVGCVDYAIWIVMRVARKDGYI